MIRTKTYSFPAVENALTRFSQEVNSRVETVVGILIYSDRPDLMNRRGSLKLDIGGKELIEEGEPAFLYMKNPLTHPVGYQSIGEFPMHKSDRRMSIQYQDKAASGSAYSPHTVYVTLFFRENR